MMMYDYILLDVLNFIYRKKSSFDQKKDLLKVVISSIEYDILSRIREGGDLYLLFDPIPKSDLGFSKTFVYTGFRKNIISEYKKNRSYDPVTVKISEIILKYFMYRGPRIKEMYDSVHEADDYVDPLLESFKKNTKEANVALVSNDLDFSRYLSDDPFRVDLINRDWDSPYTTKEFVDTFQFFPTPAANTLYKAIFGDRSDSITGCIFIKKAKFVVQIKKLALDLIRMISSNGWSIQDFIENWNSLIFNQVINLERRSPLEDFFLNMSLADQRSPVIDSLFNNIKVIRSSLEGRDVSNMIKWNPINTSFNEIIEESIFGLKFSTQFGRT